MLVNITVLVRVWLHVDFQNGRLQFNGHIDFVTQQLEPNFFTRSTLKGVNLAILYELSSKLRLYMSMSPSMGEC